VRRKRGGGKRLPGKDVCARTGEEALKVVSEGEGGRGMKEGSWAESHTKIRMRGGGGERGGCRGKRGKEVFSLTDWLEPFEKEERKG